MPKQKRTIEKKPSNPKAAMGIKKVSMSCLSSQVVALVADAFVVEEVTPDDKIDLCMTEQFSAAVSHLTSFWEGFDDGWGIPHLARAMAHIMVLRSGELDDTLDDDRVNRDELGVHVVDLNAAAAHIIEKLPDCVAPFTELEADSLGFKLKVSLTNVPFHVLPWRVVLEMALGMMEGGRKYGRHNYRKMGVRASVYHDATMRHLADYIAGKSVDHESGLSHLSKALSSSQVMLDSMVMGNWVDDRPLRIK